MNAHSWTRFNFVRLVLLVCLGSMLGCTSLHVELDKMSGAEYPPGTLSDPEAPAGFVSIPRLYADGDRLVVVNQDDANIAPLSPPDTCITLAELETLTLSFRDQPTTTTTSACIGAFTCTEHHVYGLIIDHVYGGATGVCNANKGGLMADPAGRGVFFVFYPAGDISTDEETYLKTVAHELGHTLNLHHEDAELGTIMYDFLNNQELVLSQASIDHLSDHPDDRVWPNTGIAFGDVTNAHEQGHAAQVDAGPDVAAAPLRLSLELASPSTILGEPVYVLTRLRNESPEPVTGAVEPTPEAGSLRIEIRRPDGRRIDFLPLVYEDDLYPPAPLPPHRERAAEVPIFYGGGGWTFDVPGTYEVRAVYRSPNRRFGLEAEPLEVVVAKGDSASRELFADPEAADEAGRFLVWQGGEHLRKGIALLKAIVAQHPGSPLAAHARVALAISSSRDFADYTVGRLRPAECWNTLHYLEGPPTDRVPASLRLRRTLAEARCRARAGDEGAARRLVRQASQTGQDRTDLQDLFDGLVDLYSLPR